jgi:hypothetical protein
MRFTRKKSILLLTLHFYFVLLQIHTWFYICLMEEYLNKSQFVPWLSWSAIFLFSSLIFMQCDAKYEIPLGRLCNRAVRRVRRTAYRHVAPGAPAEITGAPPKLRGETLQRFDLHTDTFISSP